MRTTITLIAIVALVVAVGCAPLGMLTDAGAQWRNVGGTDGTSGVTISRSHIIIQPGAGPVNIGTAGVTGADDARQEMDGGGLSGNTVEPTP